MANLFQTMEATAARGAAGLTVEARETLGAALRALQTAGGGFRGLDGRPDLYYSFFAWLSLRALGMLFERERLCAYAEEQGRSARGVDAWCAEIIVAREGRRSRGVGWLAAGAAMLRGEPRAVYGAFLLALAVGDVPRGVARLAWWRQRRMFAADVARQLPTSRLAAGLVLATLVGDCDTGLLPALLSRRCVSGGFSSVAGAAADLLATSVARFACYDSPDFFSSRTREDLAFVEACWLDDGLFGASPHDLHGDAEHTFYALLALGTCRAEHACKKGVSRQA
ncbi:MAG: prenyltransferase/squalene oxidase repeat-containing protein [bacterium]